MCWTTDCFVPAIENCKNIMYILLKLYNSQSPYKLNSLCWNNVASCATIAAEKPMVTWRSI